MKYLEITILGVIYFIGIIVGFLFSDNTFNSKVNNHNGLNEDLQNIFSLSPFQRFISIAENNCQVITFNIISGLLTLGIFSIIHLFYNGLIFGIVFRQTCYVLPIDILLPSTIPHSPEIIGVLLSAYIGLKLSITLLLRKRTHSFKTFLLLTACAYLITIISAFVESYYSMPVSRGQSLSSKQF